MYDPPEETWTCLYGAPNGDWLLVEGPLGQVGPPIIGAMRQLGAPHDVITRIYIWTTEWSSEMYRYHDRPHLQQELANLLGVTQQTVSRYINGWRPRMPAAAWRRLVLNYFTAEILAAI